jgi:DNA-binding FadR family transcriptional regulator
MDRVYRRIMTELLDEVVAGRIAAGERLPTVDEIAARHACSPSAAREAIRALEERRIVEVHAGQGQEVLRDDHWRLLDHDVAAAILLHHGDQRLVREALDLLRPLLTHGAAAAARKVTDGDVALLAQIVEQMRAPGGVAGRFTEAESDFQRTVIRIGLGRFAASALDEIHPVVAQLRRSRAADRDGAVIVLHERTVTALAERDATAAAAAADDYGRHLASWLRVG